MEFRDEENKLTYIEEQLATEPCINVLTNEQFEERVTKVFNIIWEKLAKSFGPGGAGTFVSIYPNYYNTKDGFNIMKNIAFDKKLDQVICDMVQSICNRLNFTVGDGTTTATIATKCIYDAYTAKKEIFTNSHILPRDVMERLEVIKNTLVELLDKNATPIRSDNPEELRRNIEKVVYISSNGNRELTDMISSLYAELMYPAINCTLSQDGTMKSYIVEGYKLDICLSDKLYINNDNNTMLLSGADIIMFDHKVTKDTYEKILRPLSSDSGQRGRHLVCIAPFYDETALSGVIKTDLNAEYRKNKDINLVLTVCSKVTGHARTMMEDLAMLLNTLVISPEMENEYMLRLTNPDTQYFELFNIDNRKIPNIRIAVKQSTEGDQNIYRLDTYNDNINDDEVMGSKYADTALRLGYCDKLELGLKESSFSGFYYNEDVYNKYVSTAKSELEEIQKKCEKIGTFSVELMEKQKRVYALGLKTGVIEVGTSSDITQAYMKDTVDDAIKAAASAYNNGVVLGCNITLMRIIKDLISASFTASEGKLTLDLVLLEMILNGFMDVASTVFMNVFRNFLIETDLSEFNDEVHSKLIDEIRSKTRFKNFYIPNDAYLQSTLSSFVDKVSLYGLIIQYAITSHTVFDLSTGVFNSDVINSAETDREILQATIDLLSLLITGNQLVLC